MFKFTLFTLAVLGTTLAYPLVYEDEAGQQFFVIPIEEAQQQQRVRRDTDYGYGSNGAFISHKQTVLNNDKHKVDVGSFAERNLHPKGPLTTGHNVDYTYKPSASTFSVGTTNTRGQGTDLSAAGQYNFFKTPDGKAQVGAYAQYDRHYGGPGGTQRANKEIGIRGTINFD